MNLDLSAAAAAAAAAASKQPSRKKKRNDKKDGNNFRYGLNPRSVLSGSSSSDDDDDKNDLNGRKTTGRDDVNRDLAAEQAALRKRAEMAAAAITGAEELYDYDGQYDTFASGREQGEGSGRRSSSPLDDNDSTSQRKVKPKQRDSRYVSDLLKAAQNRAREREIVHERKIAREQKLQEDANREEYRGKEKFVTKSYKRKLAERELWLKQEEQRAKKEEDDDVTKIQQRGDGDGSAFVASFYGNLSKNVSMGGTGLRTMASTRDRGMSDQEGNEKEGAENDTLPTQRDLVGDRSINTNESSQPDPSSVRSTRWGPKGTPVGKISLGTDGAHGTRGEKDELAEKRDAMRKAREEKVAAARVRYLLRREAKSTFAADQ